MKAQCFLGLKGMTELKATQIVIYDDLDQPLAIVSSPGHGVITIDAIGEPNFQERLKELAITAATPRSVIRKNG